MNKWTTYCLFGVIAISTSCKPKAILQEYSINVNLAADADGKKVYLKNAEHGIVDSAVVAGGAFQFKGKVDYPTIYTMTIVDEKQPNPNYQPVIPVFLENAEVKVSANLDSLSQAVHLRSGQYKYDQVHVEGSDAHQVYMDYVKGFELLFNERKVAFRNYLDYLNYGNSSKTVAEGIILVGKVDEAANKRNDYIKQYVKDHSESVVSIFIASDNISNYSAKEIDEIVASVSPKVLATEPGKKFIEEANKARNSAAGAMYTDLSFQDDKGNEVKLSEYVGKGKYVLLEFWASWCVPCRADIPHLKKNYSLYHPEGFEVISVSMDGKKEDWLRAVDEEKMEWLQISDLKAFKGEVSNVYNFSGIPTCILIDPEGKIVTRNMRGSWMDKMLIELYGDKF